ncbi:phytanoyl-CoA dioxygenase family protein [Mucilaginibacter sp. dw_454]|uniref:phytanoyl-CoA dioxygenase family protein n=1 Tax=Mucilaginibacter sp. dw_454 TaxID=2720079 RepID=UPI001BD516CF|nr:phytanoyl-CoA dioxygenase family protein [Mucilaginibacter sp. dw_454]
MNNTYSRYSLGGLITAEQKQFFNENGYIHFQNFFEKETVDQLIDASLAVQQKLLINNTKKINGVPIKYGYDVDGAPIVQRFAFINQQHPAFEELTRDDRFKLLLKLIGPDARLGINEKDGMVLNHYINGPLSKFTKMGWHTDGLRDIFLGQKLSPMLNVGIHLSDARPENGGLRLLPGTHQQSIYKLLFRKKYFLDHDTDKDEIAILPKAGDLTIHDGRLWHRVAQSSIVGEASRRRVIYIPIIAGKYQPKHADSTTAFYQRFAGIVK